MAERPSPKAIEQTLTELALVVDAALVGHAELASLMSKAQQRELRRDEVYADLKGDVSLARKSRAKERLRDEKSVSDVLDADVKRVATVPRPTWPAAQPPGHLAARQSKTRKAKRKVKKATKKRAIKKKASKKKATPKKASKKKATPKKASKKKATPKKASKKKATPKKASKKRARG